MVNTLYQVSYLFTKRHKIEYELFAQKRIILKTDDDICKQLGSRWGPTKCGASSWIQTVWHSVKFWMKAMNFEKRTIKSKKKFSACEKLISTQVAKMSWETIVNINSIEKV